MEDVKITITLKDGQVNVRPSRPLGFEDFLQVVQTAVLSAMNSLLESVPEEDQESVKKGIYESYNVAASHTLELFAPDFELRPDLTTQAILEAENKIIEEGRAPDLLE